MRKILSDKQGCRAGCRKVPAFTLAELVVAVAILALMMLLVGQIFTITVKSTGQATALTAVNQRLRLLEETLRADLRHVDRENSVLVIQGRPVKAYWTQAGVDGDDVDSGTNRKEPADGYPHVPDPEREDGSGNLVAPRADMVAFFSTRQGSSSVHPGVRANAQFIVYGHANLCDYRLFGGVAGSYRSDWDPQQDQFPLVANSLLAPASVPASQWQLARRPLMLLSTAYAPMSTDDSGRAVPDPRWREDDVNSRGLHRLTDDRFEDKYSGEDFVVVGDYPILTGLTDIVYHFDYESKVAVPVRLNDVGGIRQWWGGAVPPPFLSYEGHGQRPYRNVNSQMADEYYPVGWDLYNWFGTLGGGRSVIDLSLPAPVAEEGGLSDYFLAHCASFKVEWTFEDPDGILTSLDHVVWFDSAMLKGASGGQAPQPDDLSIYGTMLREIEHDKQMSGDPDSVLETFLNDPAKWNNPNVHARFDPRSLEFDNTIPGMFFFPRVYPMNGERMTGEARMDPFYPTALRITVDVYDDLGRLDKPIRHVMVLPIGE